MGTLGFQEQLERIKLISDARTQVELAKFLGIRQSEVSDAKRRREIPSSWLVILMLMKNVNPEWILTGKGPYSITRLPVLNDHEIEEVIVAEKSDKEALRRLPSRILADELVRRIVISQEKIFCSNNCSELQEGE